MPAPASSRDALIHGANLLDMTPTILTLFGLPVGEDMDGEPLLEASRTPPEVPPSRAGTPSRATTAATPGQEMPGGDDAETMQQLVDLGYIERPDVDKSVKPSARPSASWTTTWPSR
jgi:arylsulfatase A-like enzyme